MRMAILVIACGTLAMIAKANDQNEKANPVAKAAQKTEAAPKDIHSAEPMSIYNDQLRCFKFKIDYAVASVEEAKGFMLYYQQKGNPEILGAFPDEETNSLCVVGPPEAEQAIRKSLAIWRTELMGLGLMGPSPSLALQIAGLESGSRKNAYRTGTTGNGAGRDQNRSQCHEAQQKKTSGEVLERMDSIIQQDESTIQQLKERLESLELELAMTEGKIQVVNEYSKRMNKHQN